MTTIPDEETLEKSVNEAAPLLRGTGTSHGLVFAQDTVHKGEPASYSRFKEIVRPYLLHKKKDDVFIVHCEGQVSTRDSSTRRKSQSQG